MGLSQITFPSYLGQPHDFLVSSLLGEAQVLFRVFLLMCKRASELTPAWKKKHENIKGARVVL